VWWWLSEGFFAREGLQVEATVFNSISKITEGLKMETVIQTMGKAGTIAVTPETRPERYLDLSFLARARALGFTL
jgi:hypothetical protein